MKNEKQKLPPRMGGLPIIRSTTISSALRRALSDEIVRALDAKAKE